MVKYKTLLKLPKDKMMKGATPLKQNQGTNARQQKIILAKPKFVSHRIRRFTQIKCSLFYLLQIY